MQIYAKISEGIHKAAFPPVINAECASLVKGLCERDPSERLPMRKGEVSNIKKHKWFKDFDWEALFNQTMEVPYKPVVKSKTDIANFNARKEDMPPSVDYKDDGSGWDADFATST